MQFTLHSYRPQSYDSRPIHLDNSMIIKRGTCSRWRRDCERRGTDTDSRSQPCSSRSLVVVANNADLSSSSRSRSCVVLIRWNKLFSPQSKRLSALFLVSPSACNTFDDPNGAPYRPTWPCFSFSFIQAPIFVTQWLSENQAKMMTAESCASWKRRYSQRSIPEPKCYWRKAVTKSNSLYLTKHQFTVEHARQNGDEMEF